MAELSENHHQALFNHFAACTEAQKTAFLAAIIQTQVQRIEAYELKNAEHDEERYLKTKSAVKGKKVKSAAKVTKRKTVNRANRANVAFNIDGLDPNAFNVINPVATANMNNGLSNNLLTPAHTVAAANLKKGLNLNGFNPAHAAAAAGMNNGFNMNGFNLAHAAAAAEVNNGNNTNVGNPTNAANQRSNPIAGGRARVLRPLNAYIAFRSYYAPCFSSYQQSGISHWTSEMWNADPFQTKWYLLARSYSIIRDEVGRETAPLNGFLQIACPMAGIIPPANYMPTLGWQVRQNSEGLSLVRSFTPRPSDWSIAMLTTSYSSNDIVDYCRSVGYGVPVASIDALLPPFNMMTAAATQVQVPDGAHNNPHVGQFQPNLALPAGAQDPTHNGPHMGGHEVSLAASAITNAGGLAENENNAVNLVGEDGLTQFEADLAKMIDLAFLRGDGAAAETFYEAAGNCKEFGDPFETKDPAKKVKGLMRDLNESGETYPFNNLFDPHVDHSNDAVLAPDEGDVFNTFDITAAYNTPEYIEGGPEYCGYLNDHMHFSNA